MKRIDYKIFLLFAVSLCYSKAFALKGHNLLEVKDLPPQICKVEFGLSGLCSGFINSENTVLTASHCDMNHEKRGKITCLNGQKFDFKADQVVVYDRKNIPPSSPSLVTLSSLKHDLALVRIKGKFTVPGLPILGVNWGVNENLDNINITENCFLYGVGYTGFNGIGLAHGIEAPAYSGLQIYNPLELRGETGIAPHDSGGAYVCRIKTNDNKFTDVYVGVMTGGTDDGSLVRTFVTTFVDEKNAQWLRTQMSTASSQIESVKNVNKPL